MTRFLEKPFYGPSWEYCMAIFARKGRAKSRLLHKNISYLLQDFKLEAKALAAAVGLPVTTISRLRKEGINPTVDSLEPVAEFFRVEINDLLYEDMSSSEYQAKKALGKTIHIPIIKIEEASKWPEVQPKIEKFITSGGFSNANVFGIQLDNKAMVPVFQAGAIMVIDPNLVAKDGDHVLCLLDGEEPPVFRQVFKEGKSYFFRPVNADSGAMKQYEKFRIIGVVIKSIEDFR